MRQNPVATTVVPNEIFNLLSKEHQLTSNSKITEHLQQFYTRNNMLNVLNTLREAHTLLVEEKGLKQKQQHDDVMHVLVNFVSVLTHFQLIKK